jgi:hypothetical protein
MTTGEQLKLLSGNGTEKRQLFDYLLEQVVSGQELSEAEKTMLEFLKKEIVQGSAIVFEMSSMLKGTSGIL